MKPHPYPALPSVLDSPLGVASVDCLLAGEDPVLGPRRLGKLPVGLGVHVRIQAQRDDRNA
jgi:hypothetical protein